MAIGNPLEIGVSIGKSHVCVHIYIYDSVFSIAMFDYRRVSTVVSGRVSLVSQCDYPDSKQLSMGVSQRRVCLPQMAIFAGNNMTNQRISG